MKHDERSMKHEAWNMKHETWSMKSSWSGFRTIWTSDISPTCFNINSLAFTISIKYADPKKKLEYKSDLIFSLTTFKIKYICIIKCLTRRIVTMHKKLKTKRLPASREKMKSYGAQRRIIIDKLVIFQQQWSK